MPDVLLLRPLRPEEVRCDAGQLVGDCDVRCGIEGHTLQGRLESETVEGYCCGEYTACTSWQAAKKVEEKGGDLRRILRSMQDDNAIKRSRKALRDARLQRAQRLLTEDSPEGRQFRATYLKVMAEAEGRG